jgi:uncharacterized protein (TIGR00299 family) protein
MRIAYLDCFSGISGDMFLGALIDAGVPARVFEETVVALNIGAKLAISKVDRSGITAIKVDVLTDGELPAEKVSHGHSHPHEHAHNHTHGHSHDRGIESTHVHGRGLKEIRKIIERAMIPAQARATALAIFEALGAAESKIHNVPIETIHFHEVGAVDALVDIVCAAVGAAHLEVEEWVCSPLNVGGGTIHCAHGTFPVPAPATLELLKEAPVFSSGPQKELVTPTGAAIVKILAKRFSSFPRMKVIAAGYGAGTRDFPAHANVLRLTLGDSAVESAQPQQDVITVLEANIDDLNPQVFGHVMDQLLSEGALDVFGIPVQMKKGRPGMLLTVLASLEDADRLTQILFAETTTLGVRRRDEQRWILDRRFEVVHTKWGDVRMKIASLNGAIRNYAPEFEDCRQLATKHHVPLKNVLQEALHVYLGSSSLEPASARTTQA